MDTIETSTPTPEECIALWKKKDWLRAEVAELELEYNELQTCVKHLSNIEKHLRKSTTQLCYDLGILFNQIAQSRFKAFFTYNI